MPVAVSKGEYPLRKSGIRSFQKTNAVKTNDSMAFNPVNLKKSTRNKAKQMNSSISKSCR
ncbi:hypothetical protein Barb7_01936 [Bacteroidales bacterium Barb7]|nr:hypothetical protein Barb7_01936 [Bacteroidales bacterium Barb7]